MRLLNVAHALHGVTQEASIRAPSIKHRASSNPLLYSPSLARITLTQYQSLSNRPDCYIWSHLMHTPPLLIVHGRTYSIRYKRTKQEIARPREKAMDRDVVYSSLSPCFVQHTYMQSTQGPSSPWPSHTNQQPACKDPGHMGGKHAPCLPRLSELPKQANTRHYWPSHHNLLRKKAMPPPHNVHLSVIAEQRGGVCVCIDVEWMRSVESWRHTRREFRLLWSLPYCRRKELN
jgi:hypothetical protein